jgi:hypothetical protein
MILSENRSHFSGSCSMILRMILSENRSHFSGSCATAAHLSGMAQGGASGSDPEGCRFEACSPIQSRPGGEVGTLRRILIWRMILSENRAHFSGSCALQKRHEPVRPRPGSPCPRHALVAQWTELPSPKRRGAGSNPAEGANLAGVAQGQSYGLPNRRCRFESDRPLQAPLRLAPRVRLFQSRTSRVELP